MKKRIQYIPQLKRPIYENNIWRFAVKLATILLIVLMLFEIFLYHELTKSLSKENLEIIETILSMIILVDLIMILQYSKNKLECLKRNWVKALMALPTWIILKPLSILGAESVIPRILAQDGILQAGRGVNVLDGMRDVLDRL